MFNDERARSDHRPKGVSGSHVTSYFVWQRRRQRFMDRSYATTPPYQATVSRARPGQHACITRRGHVSLPDGRRDIPRHSANIGHISRKPAGRHDPRALRGEFVRLRRQSTSTPSPAVHLSAFSGRPLFAFPGIPPLNLRRQTTSSGWRKELTQPRRC